MDVKGEKLLILGGTQFNCEIIKKAQKLGIYTYVTDYDPVEESPGKSIADQCFNISVSDVEKIVEIIQSERINGVLTGFTDSILPYYSKICETSGLPCYATEEQFKLFMNKRRYKELLQEFKIPVIEEYQISSVADIPKETVKYPVIVKPTDNSGARGITVCNNYFELKEACNKALDYSKEQSVIIEKFIKGKEATSFWVIQNGQVFLSAMGNRHLLDVGADNGLLLPMGYTFPSSYTPGYKEDIEVKLSEMMHKIGIKNGVLFIQNIIDEGEVKVYDLGLRLTGSLEYKLLEKVCGYDPLKMLIEFSITGKMGENIVNKVDPYLSTKYPWNLSFLIKPGKINKICGIEEVRHLDDVLDVFLSYRENDEFFESEVGLLKQIACRVLGVSDTYEDMKKAIARIEKELRFLNQKGEQLLYPSLNTIDYEKEIICGR